MVPTCGSSFQDPFSSVRHQDQTSSRLIAQPHNGSEVISEAAELDAGYADNVDLVMGRVASRRSSASAPPPAHVGEADRDGAAGGGRGRVGLAAVAGGGRGRRPGPGGGELAPPGVHDQRLEVVEVLVGDVDDRPDRLRNVIDWKLIDGTGAT
ncbi:hypothetical protein ABZ801_09985 [Actinomadura sp. NPDC047616]|uniref:hypothetical protein n=1 Tax=Actinomadura sp. NPDC047616 TaxID=3155914 RepID=UPI0033D836C3